MENLQFLKVQLWKHRLSISNESKKKLLNSIPSIVCMWSDINYFGRGIFWKKPITISYSFNFDFYRKKVENTGKVFYKFK